MICPHCKKAFIRGANDESVIRILELRAEGYSLRDIEKALFAEGKLVSFSTISRILKKQEGVL